MSRAFSTSYLAGDAAARAFLPRDFRRAADRVAAAQRAAGRRIDPALVGVLRAQQAALPPDRARDRNLEALAGGHTAVVVTGQQVGLFLGPLYTFYKAATAVAVARALEAESGVRCVPLFWLQTEDHDFLEIAGCTIAGADGAPARLSLNGQAEAAVPDHDRMSVAHRRLGAEIAGLLDTLAACLGAAPSASEVLALLRRHYRAGQPLAAAFAGALAEVFGDASDGGDAGAGLLFLDPRDVRVAALAAPLFRRALDDADGIDRALGKQAARLEAAGFDVQIPPRPGSPLVFFHPRGPEGPRYRLQRDGAATGGRDAAGDHDWRLAGAAGVVSSRELLAILASEPLRFSTSALLRPLVQDALLPAAAYVGGPAEVSYLAQIEPLYGRFGVEPALVVPRGRFRCVDARARRQLAALGLAADDLALPLPELLARVARAAEGDADPAVLRRRAEDEVQVAVARIADAVVAAEPGLARAAARTRATVVRALGRLTDRYARALAERDGVTRRRLQSLRDALYPDGTPQERVLGWPTLAARLGPAAFKTLVFDALSSGDGPFDPTVRELRP